jgi:branched-chain amino acid transport system ATP-binding protein
MSNILEISNLTVRYGQITALREVSITVSRGESVALVGANGAGKTTLLKSVIGLLQQTDGEISFSGTSMNGVLASKRAKSGIGYSPEGRRVFPGLTVKENLEVASLGGRRETIALLERMYDLFPDLKMKQDKLGWTLSGGQQQMLAIARALMSMPKLLLLDEPSLGLSPKLTDEVLSQVARISKTGTSVILAEQNLSRALEITNRAYVLQTGRVALEGASADLRKDASIRAKFLGGL